MHVDCFQVIVTTYKSGKVLKSLSKQKYFINEANLTIVT